MKLHHSVMQIKSCNALNQQVAEYCKVSADNQNSSISIQTQNRVLKVGYEVLQSA